MLGTSRAYTTTRGREDALVSAEVSVISSGISHRGVRSHPPSRVSVAPGGHIARRHLESGWSSLMLTTSYIYCSITSVSTTTLAAVSNPRGNHAPRNPLPPTPNGRARAPSASLCAFYVCAINK